MQEPMKSKRGHGAASTGPWDGWCLSQVHRGGKRCQRQEPHHWSRGAVDGETDKKEEGKASVSTAPKTNKASPAFNIVDLHMPSMWPSAAVDTHREMVIKDYQKCILTFLFSFKKIKKKCDYLLSLLFLHF